MSHNAAFQTPPRLAITMGDPAGIGPEVIVKAFARPELKGRIAPVVLGDIRVFEQVIGSLGLPLRVEKITEARQAKTLGDSFSVLDLGNANPADFRLGEVNALCGRAAMDAIELSLKLALAGEVAGVSNAPINKEATKAAGIHDIGHLEYYARMTKATEYATMLATGKLRVVHLTTHYSLRRACELVTKDRILGKLRLTDSSFRRFGLQSPKVAVAALNPHGGEGGQFGDEEIQEIIPAVEAARTEGIDARGPYPADSIFNRAIGGEFDVVLALYHDQGHIPIKVHGFEESVSVALGLPLLRTSVDHGTAFDIAGKNKAEARSMLASIEVAIQIASGRWPAE